MMSEIEEGEEGAFDALIRTLTARLPDIGSCSIYVFHTARGWSYEITKFDEPEVPTS